MENLPRELPPAVEQRPRWVSGLPEEEWDAAQNRGGTSGPSRERDRVGVGQHRGSHTPTVGLTGPGTRLDMASQCLHISTFSAPPQDGSY